MIELLFTDAEGFDRLCCSSPNNECLRGSNHVSIHGSKMVRRPVEVSTSVAPEYFLCEGAVPGDGPTHCASVFTTCCNTHVNNHRNSHSFHPSSRFNLFNLYQIDIRMIQSFHFIELKSHLFVSYHV